ARLRDDLAHMTVEADDAAAVRDLDFAAISAGPARGGHAAIRGGDDRAAPTGSDVDSGMEAREVEDRVIAIAEIGCDRPLRGQDESAAFGGRRTVGVCCIDPFGAAARGPFDQLQVRLTDALEARVQQLMIAPEHQVEAVGGTDLADVDLGRERRQIFRGDLRTRSGRSKRPVEFVAGDSADSEWARRWHRRLGRWLRPL